MRIRKKKAVKQVDSRNELICSPVPQLAPPYVSFISLLLSKLSLKRIIIINGTEISLYFLKRESAIVIYSSLTNIFNVNGEECIFYNKTLVKEEINVYEFLIILYL